MALNPLLCPQPHSEPEDLGGHAHSGIPSFQHGQSDCSGTAGGGRPKLCLGQQAPRESSPGAGNPPPPSPGCSEAERGCPLERFSDSEELT